jgi:hypothetical protein
METLIAPPDSVKNHTIKLTQVLDKLNSKIDFFNLNIDHFNRNIDVIKEHQKPPPPKKIPAYVLYVGILGILFLFFKFSKS